VEFHVQDLPDGMRMEDLNDPRWLSIDWKDITLRPTWERSAEPVSMHVAAVRSGQRVGFLLSWPDPNPDLVRGFGRFPDATAIMFSLSDKVPAIPMGVGIPGLETPGRVNILQWKGDRQAEASGVDPGSVGGAQRVFLPMLARKEDSEATDLLDGAGFSTVPAASVGNERSDPALAGHSVIESNATGFGTLVYQAAEDQHSFGAASWSHGQWTVIIFRDKLSGEDVRLGSSGRIPVAFAAWDGSLRHRDGIKYVSGWHWLVLD